MTAGARRSEAGSDEPALGPARREVGAPADEIRIGISSCLLGEEVRYDGGHKRDRFITDALGEHVVFVSVCPEMEIGLGSPREPMHLETIGGEVRLLVTSTREDLTSRMRTWAERRVAELAAMDLCGYILKRDSPSCGMERVELFGGAGAPARREGRGIFAAALLDALDSLPVEEEGRLQDPRLRENFFVRVFAYRRVRSLFAGEWRLGDLVEFHAREKLLLRAHDPDGHRPLGRLVAAANDLPRSEIAETYRRGFLASLRKIATTGKTAGALDRCAGHLRQALDEGSHRELRAAIEDYRREVVPLIVPLALLAQHARRHGIAELARQSFLDLHPTERALRGHV